MFRVNLNDLDRQGSRTVRGEIPADDPVWQGLDELAPGDAVKVDLHLTTTLTGQVLARGSISTEIERQCRRCLGDVTVRVDEDVNLVWSVPDELSEDEEDGEIRHLDPSSNELDLTAALREEFLLAAPRFVLCREDCAGLCPQCGINRNEETCACTLEEPDPRWDALRALENE